jgi:nicotinamidase-related amidase
MEGNEMPKTILLVVDVQQALIDAGPVREDEFLLNLKLLIDTAHANKTEVVYVRHDSGPGDELEAGTDGWRLHRSLKPRADERIFDKTVSSAFNGTGLNEYLKGKNVGQIVLCGMQTEHCIDTTCKVAFELGYGVVIPSGGTTTFTTPFLTGEKLINFYERMIWHEPLASVVPMDEALALLKG